MCHSACLCSYSCAAVHLQLDQFGVFPRWLIFTIILTFWCLLTSFLLFLITSSVRRKEKGLNWIHVFPFNLAFFLASLYLRVKETAVPSQPCVWLHDATLSFLLFLEQFLERAPKASFVFATPLAEGGVVTVLRPTPPLGLIAPWLDSCVLMWLKTSIYQEN